MRRQSSDIAAWRSTPLCLIALASVWLAGAARAHAHAGPQVRGIVSLDAADGLDTVLVANRGLILRARSSHTWRLLCNEAYGVTTSEQPDLVARPGAEGGGASLLAATSRGLLGTDDGGCSWRGVEPFAGTAATALTRDPTRPERLYLALYGDAPHATGLHVSDDAGRSWQRLLDSGDANKKENFRSLRVAPSDPKQLYVRKLTLQGSQFDYSVMRSRDAGMTWESRTVTILPDETDLRILGISPVDPNLLVAKAESATGGPERLLVSRDGGEHFDSPVRLRTISGVAFDDTGQALWVASDDGLYRAQVHANDFVRVGSVQLVSCVQHTEQGLLLCGYAGDSAANAPGVYLSHDGGETLEPYLQLKDVSEPVSCPDTSQAVHSCEVPWQDWQREVLSASQARPDISAQTAPPLAPANPSQGVHANSGGCSSGGSTRSAQAPWLLPIGLIAWAWLRRARFHL
jgi:hypothetical protein